MPARRLVVTLLALEVALLAMAWLKPQLGLPIVLLVPLLHTDRRWRMAGGFAGATTVLLAVAVATTGFQTRGWWLGGANLLSLTVAAACYVTWTGSGGERSAVCRRLPIETRRPRHMESPL